VPLDPDLAGRSFGPTPGYDVTEDSVRAFAASTGTPYRAGDPAPVTYPIVVAFEAMTALMADPSVGIRLQNVVHGEQRFGYTRPVRVGDRLTATLSVQSVRSIAGADIITTSSAIADADGALVCTAKATLVHRGEA
jgi:acyl dehydratase